MIEYEGAPLLLLRGPRLTVVMDSPCSSCYGAPNRLSPALTKRDLCLTFQPKIRREIVLIHDGESSFGIESRVPLGRSIVGLPQHSFICLLKSSRSLRKTGFWHQKISTSILTLPAQSGIICDAFALDEMTNNMNMTCLCSIYCLSFQGECSLFS